MARETSAVGKSFLMAMSAVLRWRMTVSHLFGDFFGVGSRWFIEQGGTGFGGLAFFRQGRGPIIPWLDGLLFCLPPSSRRRTDFGRHKRSAQAWVSVDEPMTMRA